MKRRILNQCAQENPERGMLTIQSVEVTPVVEAEMEEAMDTMPDTEPMQTETVDNVRIIAAKVVDREISEKKESSYNLQALQTLFGVSRANLVTSSAQVVPLRNAQAVKAGQAVIDGIKSSQQANRAVTGILNLYNQRQNKQPESIPPALQRKP